MLTLAMVLSALATLISCERPAGPTGSDQVPSPSAASGKPVLTTDLVIVQAKVWTTEWEDSDGNTRTSGRLLGTVRNTGSDVLHYPRVRVVTTERESTSRRARIVWVDSSEYFIQGPTFGKQLAPGEAGVFRAYLGSWEGRQSYETRFLVLESGMDYREFVKGEIMLVSFAPEAYSDTLEYWGKAQNATNAILMDTVFWFWLFDIEDRYLGRVYAWNRTLLLRKDFEWIPGRSLFFQIEGQEAELLDKAARWEFRPDYTPVRVLGGS